MNIPGNSQTQFRSLLNVSTCNWSMFQTATSFFSKQYPYTAISRIWRSSLFSSHSVGSIREQHNPPRELGKIGLLLWCHWEIQTALLVPLKNLYSATISRRHWNFMTAPLVTLKKGSAGASEIPQWAQNYYLWVHTKCLPMWAQSFCLHGHKITK